MKNNVAMITLVCLVVRALSQAFNQNLEAKNIFQDVADYHEKGQW